MIVKQFRKKSSQEHIWNNAIKILQNLNVTNVCLHICDCNSLIGKANGGKGFLNSHSRFWESRHCPWLIYYEFINHIRIFKNYKFTWTISKSYIIAMENKHHQQYQKRKIKKQSFQKIFLRVFGVFRLIFVDFRVIRAT